MLINTFYPSLRCCCLSLANCSISDQNSRFFGQLTNAFLGFLALIDFALEFRCFQWGFHPDVLTADACVKMSVNQMTKALTDKSRGKLTQNFDMSTMLLKLSLVSTVFFGERVQFVKGDLQAVGRTPAWVSPCNRRSEQGIKTERAVAKKSEWQFKNEDHTKLVDELNKTGGGISQVDAMTLADFQRLHKAIFGTKGSRWVSLLDA